MSEELQLVVVPDTATVAVPQREVEVLVDERTVPIVVESVESEVVVVEDDVHIVDEVRDVNIVTVGEVGPPGAVGPAGQGTSVIKTAAVALGGQRVVVTDSNGEAIYADRSILTHRDKVLGLTTGAVSQGAQATIITYGEMVEPSWNWTPDEPVFLSTNGLMTQTAPTSGFVQRVGFPTAPTKLFVDIDTAITL